MKEIFAKYDELKKQVLIKEPLVLTGMQRREHIDSKAIFLINMNINQFLAATTGDREDHIRYVKEKTKNLQYYNELHLSNAIQYPYLKIDLESMKIEGHEGRSRLLASKLAGFDKIPVFVKSYVRLDSESDLSFPMTLECEKREGQTITLFKKDIIEFYPRSEWWGW